MSAFVLNEIRKGFYLDSVALMRLSREIAGMPGIAEAALMMATPANKAILANAGLLQNGEITAQGNDLVLAIRAESEAAARDALDEAVRSLEKPAARAGEAEAWRPRSLAAAVKAMPDANLALVSVPGDFAAAEAMKALRRGLNVMMFSDNVPLQDELALKRQAREAGLLMMGPDCGTAIIGGAPLAFANRVEPGDVGIIGASGTGTQEISCLLSEGGRGISHAIGVGGRDLKKEIGAITTLMAIDLFDADEATKHVVLVSKPPHPDVAAKVVERIARSPKPYTVCFIGADSADLPANAAFARTLEAAAEAVLGAGAIGAGWDLAEQARAHRSGRTGRVEGLYSGGTLCAEAQVVLAAGGRAVASNAAIPGVDDIAALRPGADRVLDLGADEYTRGRPHPMIDPSVRDEALRQALRDADVGVILVDLVIGYGAHADPAGHLAAILAERPANGPVLVGSVTGTEIDPQIRSVQAARLAEAGVVVAPSNAKAAALALALVSPAA